MVFTVLAVVLMVDASRLVERVVDCDVLVVGSEGAGARAAIEASKYLVKVVMVSKGRIGRCGATMTAGADFTCDGKGLNEILGYGGDLRDTPERFMKEIVADGGFLSNQKMVEAYVRDAPKRMKELIDWGMRISNLERIHGQEYARGIRTMGPEIARTYHEEVRRRPIQLVEDTMVLDLLTREGAVVGAVGVNFKTGEFVLFRTRAVVLATGGWQMTYMRTSATDDLTGDGQAMAFRAGAELIDMEMVEFSGRTLYPRGYDRFRFVNSVRPLIGAYRLNAKREQFVDRYDPDGRYRKGGHVPIVYVAIESEIAAGRGSPRGGVFLTIDGVPDIERKLDRAEKQRFPDWTLYGVSFKDFMDWWKQNRTIEEAPVVHFHCGGIRVNENCETAIQGLYAAGECSGGLWGGNRVAAATTQVFVQGAIAGRRAAESIERLNWTIPLSDRPRDVDVEQLKRIRGRLFGPLERKGGISPVELRRRIQKLASGSVGVVKDGVRLEKAVKELERIRREELPHVATVGKNRNCNREWIEALQLENMVTCLEASARSALMRTESRMGHYRTDYLITDNDKWLKNIIVKSVNGGMELTTQPIVVTTVDPPAGTMTYEEAHARGSWAEIK